ncbi:bifunctional GNAT family N-acetyltransferase/(deoxy)nucleoside triphosphate pyrophosphohydrolase [Asaia platycodi]|uniref:bifunctional GNAT family N-acetyltransferase/(deoxy)nucleoside triphosphate pyrophosphohydrolase n=1 Tax=Asaia platycodi TaxID=610243 RepID=UPI000472024D|nr:bifunctional GNAT family N-acetyltransferase/(deoxy)nucleoside triphosphate pyrophosphohydrolase [Asaia platycodi]
MSLSLDVAPYTLRPLRADDGAAVHRLVNDWSVVRMLSHLPFPYPRELADQWIMSTIDRQTAGTAWHFAICEGETLIGCIGLSLGHPNQGARIGYWVGRPYWQKGVATACVRPVVDWAFDTLPVSHILADVAEDNLASIALLERMAFVRSGTTRVPFLSRGPDPYPVLTYCRERATTMVANRNDPAAPRILLVVAGVLIDAAGRILLAQRPPGKPLAGLWEFPGGKVEPHEAPEQALIREMHEELGIDIASGCLAPFTFVSENIGARHLLMPLYVCRRWRGQPAGKEGQALAWVTADQLDAYPMPAPDRPLIPLLKELLLG